MRLLKILLLAGLLTASSGLPAAMADEGPGTFAVEGAEAVSTTDVRYVVRLTYTGDGHPARDATVTATPIDAEGVAQTPVAMSVADQEGRYEATIAFPTPGEWTVRFTAVLPPASLDHPQTIDAPTTTTTTTETTTTTTTVAPSTEPAEDDEAGSEAGGGGGFPVVVAIVGLLAVVAAGSWLIVRRSRP